MVLGLSIPAGPPDAIHSSGRDTWKIRRHAPELTAGRDGPLDSNSNEENQVGDPLGSARTGRCRDAEPQCHPKVNNRLELYFVGNGLSKRKPV